jgi:nucleoside 2-deoxyribosyltransferase
MQVYRYETPQADIEKLEGPTVFIAGPTVRGNQPHLTSWRFEAIEEFERQGFKGNLVIPEFLSKEESDKGKDWIPLWENAGLNRADCILFWIPRTKELIGLTTNFEIGYWVAKDRGKVIYGRPDDAYRIGYVDIMWNQSYIETGIGSNEIYNTLDRTIFESSVVAHQRNPIKQDNACKLCGSIGSDKNVLMYSTSLGIKYCWRCIEYHDKMYRNLKDLDESN